jgi:hypothetical protein
MLGKEVVLRRKEERQEVRLWREGSCGDFRASFEGSRVTELGLADLVDFEARHQCKAVRQQGSRQRESRAKQNLVRSIL